MLCLVASLFAVLFLSCGKHSEEPSGRGLVTFHNESSYSVTIHQDYFDGFVLADKLPAGNSFPVTVNPSDNYGTGSVFSIEYWFMVASGTEVSGGDVWTGGIVDPSAQIMQNIEAGQSYDILIPQPTNWKTSEAFVKIANKSGKPLEFNHLGVFYRQGNSEIPVPSGKIGVYRVNKLNSSEEGVEVKNCTITQVFETYSFPEFNAMDGYIYNFEFDGKEVKKTGEKKL